VLRAISAACTSEALAVQHAIALVRLALTHLVIPMIPGAACAMNIYPIVGNGAQDGVIRDCRRGHLMIGKALLHKEIPWAGVLVCSI